MGGWAGGWAHWATFACPALPWVVLPPRCAAAWWVWGLVAGHFRGCLSMYWLVACLWPARHPPQGKHGCAGQHGNQRLLPLLTHLHAAPPHHGERVRGSETSLACAPAAHMLAVPKSPPTRLATHPPSCIAPTRAPLLPQRHHLSGAYKPTDFFETSAMLITLMLFGKYLESSVS